MLRLIVVIALMFSTTYCFSQNQKSGKSNFKDYVTSKRDSAGKAYSLWSAATKGKWKGINTDSLYSAYQVLSKRGRENQFEFIRRNPGSYEALEDFEWSTLHRRTISLDTILSVFSSFSNELRESPRGKSIEASLARKKAFSIKTETPDFSFKASDGATYDLKSFRGKNVLLCFWASWCGPCIKSIPQLKGLHDEQKNDLQLISISIDKDEISWVKALEKYQIPWLQTCDIAAYTFESQVRTLYDIHYIPQYFLLDTEGKLVYHGLFENEDEFKKFRDVLYKLKK